jgi:hypothetical protein
MKWTFPKFSCLESVEDGLGAWITSHARKRALKIALAPKKRPWLDGLFSNADALAPPFAHFSSS